MIEFGELYVEGFLSIVNPLKMNLNYHQVVWVKGRNGVGKSTLFETISWVLYGITFKGLSNVETWEHKKKYSNKGYRGTIASLYFTSGDNIYQVIRCQSYTGKVKGSKGKDRLIFLVNDEEYKKKRKKEIQQAINTALGMNWDIFRNSVMFGQGAKRLIQESNTDKKKLFEDLFDIGWVQSSKDFAVKEFNKIKETWRQVHEEIDNVKNSIEDTREIYKDLKESEEAWEDNIATEYSRIQKEILESKVDKKKLKTLEMALTKAANDLHGTESILNTTREEYQKYKKEILNVTSSDGLHDFVTKIIKLVSKNPLKAVKELQKLRGYIENQDKHRDLIDELTNSVKLNRERYQNIKIHVDEINKVKGTIEKLEDRLKRLKEQENKITSPKYKKKLKKLKKEYKELSNKEEQLKNEYEEWQWVIQEPFGNKGIKSYVIESNLDTLNEILDRYSDIIGYRIEFGIDLYSVKKDFYALIEIEGHIVEYNDLSGGQKQLVHVAMALAMHEIKGSTILFLDEVFESLSKDNVEVVVELIRSISHNRTIFILSHQASLPLGNCKIIQIDQQNGVTVFK